MVSHSKTRLAILLLILLAAGAVLAWQLTREPPATDHLTLYGNIDLRQVQIAFDQSARIETLTVQAGDRVEQGELLGTLDPRRFRADLAAAQAELDTRQAALDRLLAGTRPQEIERLRGVVAADEATLEGARLTWERTEALAQRDLASRQSRDQARAALDAARGQLRADQQSLALAIEGPRQEDIAEARAAVAAAHARRQMARIAIEDTTLEAPSAGVIRNRIQEPGDMTSPGQPVFSLALTEPLWARVYADGEDLGHLREGLPATITTDSFPDQPVEGWIGYISPSAEFTPKSVETTRVRSELVYQVRVYTCNPSGRLLLGMPVTVRVPLDAEPVNRGSEPCR
ncbi:MAG TPA: HlyD family efflux transporter periplasmic adaptor subunit [Guyparkeria sp.]|nr:HlyD family efflux transporter periplasmic adaptor subunit [Guyparkeria sp.]